jgi:phosphoribosylformylglycinamidine (FGAM) synthase PurS component
VAWRLFSAGNEPVDAATLTDAATKLLCNPAIERAHFG